jgi:hypothetical protein
MDIVGSFVQVDSPDGTTYRTGAVVARVSDDSFLVRFDNMGDVKAPTIMELFHTDEMAEYTTDGLKRWRFFSDAEEYRKWFDWVDSPSPPKVVNLVKK